MTSISKLITLSTVFLLFQLYSTSTILAFNPKEDIIESQRITDFHQLIDSSDLIVFGTFGSVQEKMTTSHSIQQGHLVNNIQNFQVEKEYKGPHLNHIHVLLTGIEPLPDPKDPINLKFTGEITSQNPFVCFFKKIPGTSYYQLNGGWSGAYPYINNKLLALEDAGIKRLDQLSLPQLEKLLHEHGL